MTSPPPQPPAGEHAWCHEHLAAYLAGGLSADERGRLDAHLNACADCFDAFTEARDADRVLQRALTSLAPPDDFETRLITTLREKTMPVLDRHYVIRRVVYATAGCAALAATGVFASHAIRQNSPLGNPMSRYFLAQAERSSDFIADPVSRWMERPVEKAASSNAIAADADWNAINGPVAQGKAVADDIPGARARQINKGQFKASVGDREVSKSPKDSFIVNGNNLYAGATVVSGGTVNQPADAPMQQDFAKGTSTSEFTNGHGSTSHYFDYGAQKLGDARSSTQSERPNGNGAFGPQERFAGYLVYQDSNAPAPANSLAAKSEVTRQPNVGTEAKDLAGKEAEKLAFGRDTAFGISRKIGAGDLAVATGMPSPTTPSESPATQTPPPPANPSAVDVSARKIIRNGTVEFEVRSFDDSYATISSITTEEGGFVASTSSEKLANGKVRGTVVVRVPPEKLDRLLLKLRALGDLKAQQIAANDVTKQYTDTESELRGLRTMESRILDLIKSGKGEVKDLVEAEKQLGEYRVRIEKLEGEIRYYNNLIGMATLSITAYEKDIQTPTAAAEQENMNLGLETEEVETQYASARKILTDAKARILDSQLNNNNAQQVTATITADVSPDKADAVANQLRTLGKVTTFSRARKQTTTGGSGTPDARVQVDQKDTRIVLSLFNLANLAPRETAVLTIAVKDVEAAQKLALTEIRQQKAAADHAKPDETRPAGRILSSTLNGQLPEQKVADLRAELRSDDADNILNRLRAAGEVLSSTTSETTDNATTAKRGLQLRFVSIHAVPPRDTQSLRAVAADVPAAYNALLTVLQPLVAKGDASINASTLQQNDPKNITASLQFQVRRELVPVIDKAMADAGIDIVTRVLSRNASPAGTVDTKIGYILESLIPADALEPRRTLSRTLEVDNVDKALETLRAFTDGTPIKESEFNQAREPSGRVTGHLTLDTPVAETGNLLAHVQGLGVERDAQVTRNPNAPDSRFARDRVVLTLVSRTGIVQSDQGLWSTMRAALSSAAAALLYSVYLVVTGALFILPFALVIWPLWRFSRKRKPA